MSPTLYIYKNPQERSQTETWSNYFSKALDLFNHNVADVGQS